MSLRWPQHGALPSETVAMTLCCARCWHSPCIALETEDGVTA
jgi:hypothetical protein